MTSIHSDDAVRLAGQLAAALKDGQRVVIFTGTANEQGVSTVAAEVAIALARRHPDQVLLVDAQAEAPTLHVRFGIPSKPGLTDVLEGSADLQTAISRQENDALAVLPLGNLNADAIGLFGSAACTELLHSLRQKFRLIIIDAAPLLLSAATSLLASQADAVVAVVASGRSQRADLKELKRILDGLKVRLLGSVLTSDAAGPLGRTRPGRQRTVVKVRITTRTGSWLHPARRTR